jgi:hypothetical protein
MECTRIAGILFDYCCYHVHAQNKLLASTYNRFMSGVCMLMGLRVWMSREAAAGEGDFDYRASVRA